MRKKEREQEKLAKTLKTLYQMVQGFGILNVSMLKKQNRLIKKRDVETVLKSGYFVSGVLVSLRVWGVDREKYSRRGYGENDLKIGFVVGKKISGSAVKRNKIKRQVREAVYSLFCKGLIKTGYYVVVIAKPHIVGSEYKDIMSDIDKVFKKAGLSK